MEEVEGTDGVLAGALKGGRLVNEPSPTGIGSAEEAAGCNGGLREGFVNASN